MAIVRYPLELGKHFVTIDSPVKFRLVDDEGDGVPRPAQFYELDCWQLTKRTDQNGQPVRRLYVEYDDDDLADGDEVRVESSNLSLGQALSGVNGQNVSIVNQKVPVRIEASELDGLLVRVDATDPLPVVPAVDLGLVSGVNRGIGGVAKSLSGESLNPNPKNPFDWVPSFDGKNCPFLLKTFEGLRTRSIYEFNGEFSFGFNWLTDVEAFDVARIARVWILGHFFVDLCEIFDNVNGLIQYVSFYSYDGPITGVKIENGSGGGLNWTVIGVSNTNQFSRVWYWFRSAGSSRLVKNMLTDVYLLNETVSEGTWQMVGGFFRRLY